MSRLITTGLYKDEIMAAKMDNEMANENDMKWKSKIKTQLKK